MAAGSRILSRNLKMKTKNYSPAHVRSASFDEEANTVDIVWSTGADVLREDYDGPFIERLSMEPSAVDLSRLNAGAPMLDTHAADCLGSVIGVVVSGSARIEDGKGLATVKLSSASSDADSISKIREGVIKNISVGYWIERSERQEGNPPIVFVDKWTPLEVSAVPIPADAGAQIRSVNSKGKPLSKIERRFRNGAAYARRLLQATKTSGEARGAQQACKTLGSVGRLAPVGKVEKMSRRDVENGARVARKLLRVAK
jgi:HK97 family phage prohead protease